MKNRILAGIVAALLVLSMFQITLNITLAPAVFGSGSMAYKEIWQVVNVTNTHGSQNTSGNINIALNNRTGVNIAWSTDITKYFKNFTYWNATGYKTYKDWLNGTTTLPYHWGEMDWYVSEGSLTSITWDEIKYWWDMYKDSGGGVSYSTFMGNTYMADFNFTDPTNDPDIIRYNQTDQTHIGAPWVGNSVTIKDLVVPANTTIYLVLKIVITIPGAYTFNITSSNSLLQISPSYWRTGGAATILVPDEYHKIQDAINYAKSGDTIVVFDGVYDEQLVITKSLTLQGMGNDTIIKPSSAAKLTQVFNGLFWYGTPNTKQIAGIIVANVPDGSNVTIKNLEVNESLVITKPTGADYLTGIFYRETAGTIDTANIVGTGAWSGADRAFGIYLSAATNTVSVEVKNSILVNYDKNGIEAMGKKLTFNIHHNVLTGRGPTLAGDEVQNGINAGRGSLGTVNNNVISNMSYTPETWWSAGILFYDYVFNEYGHGSVAGNTITDCQIGAIFINCNSTAQGNKVNGGTVGLIGLSSEPEKGGVWTASFVNNAVTGVRDSPGYENAAIDAQTYNASALITVTIENNTLKGGGSTNADGIYIDGSAGTVKAIIKGNIISGWQNGTALVNLVDVGSSISGNTIANNTVGIQVEAAVNAVNIPTNRNNIFGNSLYGIRNFNSLTLDAKYNWWGNETGPHHSVLNPNGSGDNVSDNVEFKPWLIQLYPPAAQVSKFYIDPSLIRFWTPAYGSTFVIHVKTNVTLLAGFQFKLVWNRTLLKLTGVTYYAPWTPYFKAYENITTNSYALALSGYNTSVHYPFSGSTTLASLSFQTIFDPVFPNNVTCSLSLEDVVLSDPAAKPIPFLKYNGTYECYASKPKLALSPQKIVVKKVPSQFDIKVNITNIINLNAFKFNITYNPALIQAQTIKVEPFFNASYFVAEQRINNEIGLVSIRVNSITPAANGSGVLATIAFKVVSSVIWPDLPLSCNFTFSSSNLTGPGNVTLQYETVGGIYTYQPVKGDLNRDGTVGLYDLVKTALAFGSRSGTPNWDPATDMIRDGVINILDIIVVASNYGSTG
jgi:hypothetical protein